jgi:hypothetical protein
MHLMSRDCAVTLLLWIFWIMFELLYLNVNLLIFCNVCIQVIFRSSYVTAISCAVRGGQLNLACGPFLVSYLYRGRDMTMRDVRLVQGVICRTYFDQFTAAEEEFDSEEVSFIDI